jgi:site-specific DNA recombinase
LKGRETLVQAILIARVSDPDQRQALPAQKQRLLSYAERERLAYEYVEFDESAFKDTRPIFAKLVLEPIEKSKEPVIVVFDKIDRFTRDSSSSERQTLNTLRKEGKIELHFPSDNLYVSKDSPAADLFRLDIGIALASYYSSAIRDNVKRRFEQKWRDGEWTGPAPIGYLNQRIDENHTTVIQDSLRAMAIKKAFELRRDGMPYSGIRVRLLTDGLRTRAGNPLSTSSIEEILKNPFYYGEMLCKGRLYPHIYEPIVSRSLWDQVQAVNSARRLSKTKHMGNDYIFKSLVCAYCGYTISSDRKKNKYTYLKCTEYGGACGAVRTTEEKLVTQVRSIFDSIQIPRAAIELVVEELQKSHASEQDRYKAAIKRLRSRYDQIDNNIKIMYQDRLHGRITAEQYDDMVANLKREQSDILMQLEDHSEGDKQFLINASYILELANRAGELFESSEVSQKRQLIEMVLSNLKLEGEKLVYNLKAPFDAIAECSQNDSWLRRPDSNRRPID